MQRYAYDHNNQAPMISLKEGEVGKDQNGNDAHLNQWVRYLDVQPEIGRLKGIIAEHDRAVFNVEVAVPVEQYSPPGEMRGGPKDLVVSGERINQLLNELYHDRSRLERQLQHAAELAADAAQAFQDLLNKDYGDRGVEEPMSEELVAAVIAGSKLGEFSEANGAGD